MMKVIESRGDFKAISMLKGNWLYDNIKLMDVQIFRLNYDYFYELNEGYNVESPKLNELGEQYVIAWHGELFYGTNQNISFGGLDLNEAMQAAEGIVKQKIEWN